MGVLDLARRLDELSQRDSPSTVPAGQRLDVPAGGTNGTCGTVETRGTLGTGERSGDDIEERTGMAADCVPAIYLETWARLNCRKPQRIGETDWRRALDDGGRFLDRWGDEAAALGWTAAHVFHLAGGLVWRLGGRTVEALGRDRVRLDDGQSLQRK